MSKRSSLLQKILFVTLSFFIVLGPQGLVWAQGLNFSRAATWAQNVVGTNEDFRSVDIPDEMRASLQSFIEGDLSTPSYVAGLKAAIDSHVIPDKKNLAELSLALLVAKMSDDLGQAMQKGRTELHSILEFYAMNGLRLEQLVQLKNELNGGKAFEIQVPIYQPEKNLKMTDAENAQTGAEYRARMLEKANQRLERSGLGQVIQFHADPNFNLTINQVPDNAQKEEHQKWVKGRNLSIPEIAFWTALLSGITNAQGMEDIMAGMKQMAMPVLVSLSVGLATMLLARPLVKKLLSTTSHKSLFLGATVSAGVVTSLGEAAIAPLLTAWSVGGLCKFLEWQFSQYSDQWNKWVWQSGWLKFFSQKMQKFDATFGSLAVYMVNILYPLLGFGAAAVGTELAQSLDLTNVSEQQFSLMKLFWPAFLFSASFGMYQIFLGKAEKEGILSELPRFKKESIAVGYNNIGRIISIALSIPTLGYFIMGSFGAAVTLPFAARVVASDFIEAQQDAVLRRSFETGQSSPWSKARYLLKEKTKQSFNWLKSKSCSLYLHSEE